MLFTKLSKAKYISLSVFLLLLSSQLTKTCAQTKVIDSLLIKLENHPHQDSLKVDLLNKTASENFRVNNDKILEYSTKAYTLANKLNYTNGRARSFFLMGLYWYLKSDFDKSLEYYDKSLELYKQLKNNKGQAHCLNNMGLIYRFQGNYPKALESYLASLEIAKKLNDDKTMAYCYGNIGTIQRDLNHDSLAIDYFKKSLEIKLKINDERGAITSYRNIGTLYKKRGDYVKALDNYNEVLKISKKTSFKYGLSTAYKEIGEIYEKQSRLDEALIMLHKSLALRNELGDKIGVSVIYFDIGKVYLDKNIFNKALDYTHKSLKISLSINAMTNLNYVYKQLSEIYEAKNNYPEALKYYKLYKQYSDSIFNKSNVERIAKAEARVKYNQDKKIALLKHQKEEAVFAAKARQNRIVVILLIAVLLIIILTLLLLIRLNNTKKKANRLLTIKNNKITIQTEQLTNYKNELEDLVQQRTEALITEKEKAKESALLKTAFLNNISHEFRTPMNGILGFSSMLIEPDTTDAERQEYTEIIKESCNQLLNIVNDTVEISEVHSNQVVITKSNTNIVNIIEEVIKELTLSYKLKDLVISTKLTINDEQQNILTDKNKVKRVFWHLISNAIKFTPQGTVSIYGEVIDNTRFQFKIEDTGIGISKEMQRKIFEPFRQVETTSTRNYGGNGVGLSLAKAYIELLGGTIRLKSSPGEGTTFIFTLPAQWVETPVIQTTKTGSKSLEDKTVLIAEDNELNYLLIQSFLAPLKLKLIRARNGKEAVDIFNTTKIDLILMDLKMPVMDGYEAVQNIKKTNPNIIIIAQSAFILDMDIKKIKNSGFDDFIAKPIKKSELIRKIHQFT